MQGLALRHVSDVRIVVKWLYYGPLDYGADYSTEQGPWLAQLAYTSHVFTLSLSRDENASPLPDQPGLVGLRNPSSTTHGQARRINTTFRTLGMLMPLGDLAWGAIWCHCAAVPVLQ